MGTSRQVNHWREQCEQITILNFQGHEISRQPGRLMIFATQTASQLHSTRLRNCQARPWHSLGPHHGYPALPCGTHRHPASGLKSVTFRPFITPVFLIEIQMKTVNLAVATRKSTTRVSATPQPFKSTRPTGCKSNVLIVKFGEFY